MTEAPMTPDTPPPAPPAAKPPRGGSRWLLILAGIVALWAVFMVVFVPRKDGSGLEPPEIARPKLNILAPIEWELKDLRGQPVDFKSFQGKTVFLNIWATWCGPCLREMPSIDRLASDPRLKDVVFLGVSMDDDHEAVRQWVARHNPKMTVVLPDGKMPERFETEGIPATFVIGPKGLVELSHVGTAKWDAPEVVSLLERLSRSPSPSL